MNRVVLKGYKELNRLNQLGKSLQMEEHTEQTCLLVVIDGLENLKNNIQSNKFYVKGLVAKRTLEMLSSNEQLFKGVRLNAKGVISKYRGLSDNYAEKQYKEYLKKFEKTNRKLYKMLAKDSSSMLRFEVLIQAIENSLIGAKRRLEEVRLVAPKVNNGKHPSLEDTRSVGKSVTASGQQTQEEVAVTANEK